MKKSLEVLKGFFYFVSRKIKKALRLLFKR